MDKLFVLGASIDMADHRLTRGHTADIREVSEGNLNTVLSSNIYLSRRGIFGGQAESDEKSQFKSSGGAGVLKALVPLELKVTASLLATAINPLAY